MADIKEILAAAHKMPVLSQSALRIMELIGEENHALQDLAKVIETDPVLTLEVMKVANSAALGLRQQVVTIAEAIPYLGEKMVTGIAMKLCSPKAFNRPLLGYESARGELWAHGLKAAIASSELTHYAKADVSPGLAYTAGILHDIGKPILSKFLSGSSAQMVATFDNSEASSFLEIEETVVGTNHCEVGGELAKHWNLPPSFESVIRNHHSPANAEPEHHFLVYIVHLADMISMMSGSGTGTDSMGYTLDSRYTEFIDISRSGLDDIIMKVIIEFEKTYSALFGTEKDGEK